MRVAGKRRQGLPDSQNEPAEKGHHGCDLFWLLHLYYFNSGNADVSYSPVGYFVKHSVLIISLEAITLDVELYCCIMLDFR